MVTLASDAAAPRPARSARRLGALAAFLREGGAQTASRRALVALRLYLGLGFLHAAAGKLGPGRLASWPATMEAFIRGRLDDAYGFYRVFLEAVVLARPDAFAWAVAWGEAAVGAALLIGACTRLAGAAGFLLAANFLLLQGTSPLDVSHDAAFAVGCLVVGAGAAGRAFGLDARLARRWPHGLPW